MPVTLLSSQIPAPVFDTAHTKLSDRYVSSIGVLGLSGKYFSAGDTSTVPSYLNRNQAQLDLQGRYGGGGYGICVGLTLSAGSGLTLNIAAGIAFVDGLVEVSSATTTAVADGHNTATDRVWVWLTRAGAISTTLNTTPPETNCCCLGSCTTSGGVITAVDTSGVVYLKGGSLYRETADYGPPTDSPSSALTILTKTLTGLYLWETGAHRAIFQRLSTNLKVYATGVNGYVGANEQVVLYGGFTATGTGGITVDSAGEVITL